MVVGHRCFISQFFSFQAHMKFPPDYPYSPPSIRFMTKVWHPNVYEVSEHENYRFFPSQNNPALSFSVSSRVTVGSGMTFFFPLSIAPAEELESSRNKNPFDLRRKYIYI